MHSLVLVALAGVLLWQAGRMHGRLLAQRGAMSPGEISALESMPPIVAFTSVALGGFRGFIADMLWLRSTKMQEEGRYFELVQLANWITTLEPRLTPVWSFHAWNLAYNISVLFNDHADRWRWVRHGIELLRDKAIVYNPGDAGLYGELAWTYLHKVGEKLDQAHRFYKTSWAHEMAALFEGRGPDYEAMAAAAKTEAELMERPAAAELVGLLEELGHDPFSPVLLAEAGHDEELAGLIKDHAGAEDLVRFLRRKLMVETYKLEPATMAEIEEEYGPVDWRMPQAHALYWSYLGLPHAEGFDAVRLKRSIFQAHAIAFREGSAFVDIDGNVIPSPTPELIPYVEKAFEKAIEEEPDMERSYTEAYVNFMREAISVLYSYHRIEDARALFEKLTDVSPSPETAKGFEAFVQENIRSRMEQSSARTALSLIEGFVSQSYTWQALGDEERAAGYFQLAALYYQQFMVSLRPGEHTDRLGLPPFKDVVRLTLERMPDDHLGPLARTRLQQLREEGAGEEEPAEAETGGT